MTSQSLSPLEGFIGALLQDWDEMGIQFTPQDIVVDNAKSHQPHPDIGMSSSHHRRLCRWKDNTTASSSSPGGSSFSSRDEPPEICRRRRSITRDGEQASSDVPLLPQRKLTPPIFHPHHSYAEEDMISVEGDEDYLIPLAEGNPNRFDSSSSTLGDMSNDTPPRSVESSSIRRKIALQPSSSKWKDVSLPLDGVDDDCSLSSDDEDSDSDMELFQTYWEALSDQRRKSILRKTSSSSSSGSGSRTPMSSKDSMAFAALERTYRR